MTAKDPAGPWSDPVWLSQIDGIAPSFSFDEDGRAYVISNGPPEGQPLYDGHRALWIQDLDLAAARLTGPRQVIVNAASTSPDARSGSRDRTSSRRTAGTS